MASEKARAGGHRLTQNASNKGSVTANERPLRWEWLRAVGHPASPFSANARHFAHTLTFGWMDNFGWCFPSIETIAEHMGRTKDTVRKAIAELETAGFLDVTRGGRWRGDNSEYLAILPEWVEWLDPFYESDENEKGLNGRRKGLNGRRKGRMVRPEGSSESYGTNQGTNHEPTNTTDETLTRSPEAVLSLEQKASGEGGVGPCVVCDLIDEDGAELRGWEWRCSAHLEKSKSR